MTAQGEESGKPLILNELSESVLHRGRRNSMSFHYWTPVANSMPCLFIANTILSAHSYCQICPFNYISLPSLSPPISPLPVSFESDCSVASAGRTNTVWVRILPRTQPTLHCGWPGWRRPIRVITPAPLDHICTLRRLSTSWMVKVAHLIASLSHTTDALSPSPQHLFPFCSPTCPVRDTRCAESLAELSHGLGLRNSPLDGLLLMIVCMLLQFCYLEVLLASRSWRGGVQGTAAKWTHIRWCRAIKKEEDD